MKTLNDLFIHVLKDVYHAEKQLLRALPKMAKSATDPKLRQAFEHHREETLGQVERLEKIFDLVDRRARGEPCEAIQGLIEEAKEVMEDAKDPSVMDAGLLSSAQAVEHYEIARYGTLRTWAQELGNTEAAKLLEETLAEERNADKLLNELATARINKKAA